VEGKKEESGNSGIPRLKNYNTGEGGGSLIKSGIKKKEFLMGPEGGRLEEEGEFPTEGRGQPRTQTCHRVLRTLLKIGKRN